MDSYLELKSITIIVYFDAFDVYFDCSRLGQ